MKFYRPKSVLSLVLIGFSTVALPLIVSLVYAIISVDRLLDQSQQAVIQAVEATKGSLKLTEALKGMERSIRQFQILGDKTFFQIYLKSHQDLQDIASALKWLSMEEKQSDLLQKVIDEEQALFDTIKKTPRQSLKVKVAISTFTSLSDLAQSILSENRRLVSREIERMKENSEKTQKMLAAQAMSIIPIAVILAIVFTILIARPIRQIDQTIRKMGDGTLSSKISISGPKDLEVLGNRLDWLRSRLNELETQKIQFLRHVSHELKTPLTSSRAGAELLNDEVVGKLNDEQQKVVGILHQSLLQLQKMIENLLNFSVVLEKHATFTLEPVPLKSLIEKVLSNHQLALRAGKIKIDFDLREQSVSGDADKLTVVVDNLISNAVKFSPPNGLIQVRLDKDGDDIKLDVIDSGPGIDPEDQSRVFDPFYQGRQSAGINVEGTGIGLSLAKEYVLAHHGTIEIVQHPSEGTHMRVLLPVNPFKDLT